MKEYMSALLAHWVFLMGGIGSLVFGIIVRIGRIFSDVIKEWKDIPDWIFILVGIIFLFIACYKAWQDKNKALVNLQEKLKSPHFKGEVTLLSAGEMNGYPLVIIDTTIQNPNGPP